MNKNNWHGLMNVLEIKKLDKFNNIVWENNNIKNVLHSEGEKFLLQIAFQGTEVPSNYYLGLDNRAALLIGNTIDDIVGEPISGFNGYERQELSSSTDFTINFNVNYKAVSPIVAFRSTFDGWGPCSNLFLSTFVEQEEILISSIKIPNAILLDQGESVTIRLSMQIRDLLN